MVQRERKNRKKRKYGQAKLKHSKRGVLSCSLSGFVGATMLAMIARAYFSAGKASPFIGAVGLISVILAGCGLYFGIRGFREREKNYLTCKIGIASCSVFIFGFILIFCRGLFS